LKCFNLKKVGISLAHQMYCAQHFLLVGAQVQDKDLVTIMFHMRSLGACAVLVLLRLLYDIFMVGNVGDCVLCLCWCLLDR